MNKNIMRIVGGILAVLLLCVVIVGLINGVWPWSEQWLFENYKGEAPMYQSEPTTQSTENTTEDETNSTTVSTQNSSVTITPPENNPVVEQIESTAGTESAIPENTDESTSKNTSEQEIAFDQLPE